MSIDPICADPHFDKAHGVLRNIPGITEQSLLERYEGAATADALICIQMHPVLGRFDRKHLQEIHRAIFAQVYPWAGELRRVNIQKPGSFPFATAQFLSQNLDDLFAKLRNENQLKGLPPDQFAERTAFFLGELNALHPFREGNGRTQREFFRQLASVVGYRLNWGLIGRDQMIAASIDSHIHGRNEGFVALLRKVMGL